MEQITPGGGFRDYLITSFPDKTTLLKITLVVLSLLSIAAAITLGGWGERLLPDAFTFNYQIITGSVLGTVGLSLGLGVLAWQIAHPTLKEIAPPLPPLWEVTLGEGTNSEWLVRREFTDKSGCRIEVFIYGEEAQLAMENGVDNVNFLSNIDVAHTLLWQNYVHKGFVKASLCIKQKLEGGFEVYAGGLIFKELNSYNCSQDSRFYKPCEPFDIPLTIFDEGKKLLIISPCKTN